MLPDVALATADTMLPCLLLMVCWWWSAADGLFRCSINKACKHEHSLEWQEVSRLMGHSVSDLVAISISGISKIFVGELIEEGAFLLLLFATTQN